MVMRDGYGGLRISMSRTTFIAIVLCGCTTLFAADDDAAFFESKIRPLLIARCFECHSGKKTSGGLALDTRAGWEKGGDSGPAIVPGKPDESVLIKAVSYTEPDLAMPPETGGGKLSVAEIAALGEWVRRGATDPRVSAAHIGGMTESESKSWWAFQPIAEPPVPAVKAPAAVVYNEIDSFILARLEGTELAPAPMADRRTLIRRATYDLTGLPPTPQDVEAYVDDASPDAYAKVVERLLDSPRYGEAWGRHWLDVVRYADTAGENTDRPLPHMWRYRNWVFDAFNRDLPFDEFVRLQLAGDVLRSSQTGAAHTEGIIATGYLALARRFGHDSDKDAHLMHEDVIDNLGKAFLGLTIACARCHDHKYDPVSNEDYYALYGIFASSRFSFAGCEAKGQPRDLVAMLTAAEAEALKRPWRERMAESDLRLNEIAAQTQSARERMAHGMATANRVLAAADVAEGGSVSLGEGQKEPLDGIRVRKGEILMLLVSPRGSHGADSTRVEWEIAEVGGGGRRWSVADLIQTLLAGNPHAATSTDATLTVATSPVDAREPIAQWCFLDMADGPAFLNEKLAAVEGHGEIKAWRNGDTPSVFVNSADQPVSVWTTLPPRSFFVHPGPRGPVAVAWLSPFDGVVAVTGSVGDIHPAGGDGVAFSLQHVASADVGAALAGTGGLASERAEIVRRRDAELGPEPVAPVAFAVVEAEATNVRLHQRGDPEKPGDEVSRHWLTVFGGDLVPPGAGSGRRELAEWIVRNPLSSRVIVNRVWQGHFGKGLVGTPNDFGSRGQRPTHAELLDWLCAQFEKEGRHLKALHRLIMTSAAYQRASAAGETSMQADPENRLLAHFNRRRLSAEELRDSLLVAGGNLDPTPGEAHPFPAESTWTFTQHNPFSAVYDNDKRTAYQMVQRQRRHPFLSLFDGADPNASIADRQTTTAPTQALFFLNDPFFHAQAARLAGSLLGLPGDEDRLRRAFGVALQREPTPGEQEWAARFLAAYPGTLEEKWSGCVRVLLAGNEFIHLD